MKRLLDIFFVLILIVAFSPIILILCLTIWFTLGSPLFFIQSRPGFNGRPFRMIKFRTMREMTGSDGNILPDSERITRFGSFLRATSLDEIPEFWNVLKGDMSLVGPRPLLTDYLELYTPQQARRHEVRPGITGWAQVNGRNAISWEKKFELDVWYVDNMSLFLDIKILFMTVQKVFNREGISATGEATMPIFKGTIKDEHEV